MEKETHHSDVDEAIPCLKEDAMEPMMESVTVQPTTRTTPTNPCAHGRAIDDVLTRGKKRTGKVRCLECGTVFDDPHLKQE